MDTLEKSVALAKLMNLKVKVFDDSDWKYKRCYVGFSENTTYPTYYKPYSDCVEGLAQFAAILLKYPEVIEEFVCTASHTDERAATSERYEKYGGDYQGYLATDRPVTQESLLDAVLKMKGEDL